MYATIRRYKVKPGAAFELFQKVDQGFVPIISKSPGFIAYYALDIDDGTVVSFSIFQGQAGAEESNRLASEWARLNVASLVDGPPATISGEVIIHKTP
jgi:hypothetical protein